MPNIPIDPFDGLILDKEEQAIEDAVDEYKTAVNFNESKKLIEEAAMQYIQLNTSKPVTIRINQKDLIKVKAKAKRNNIPYQTLLGAVIHDFAEERRELNIK